MYVAVKKKNKKIIKILLDKGWKLNNLNKDSPKYSVIRNYLQKLKYLK